jgi:2'-5' RNA ligase
MARLFFALWPDAAAREKLAWLAGEIAAAGEGKPVPAAKIHLTLAFLGSVAEERVAEAARAASELQSPAFALEVDRIGAFRSARVAWAGISRPPGELIALQAQLAAGLRARGFELEEREFAPHLTLVRKFGKGMPAASIESIPWEARDIALVRSGEGTGRYTTLASWPLTGD